MKNSIGNTYSKYFDSEKFRKRLKELRKETGMTQDELAFELGLIDGQSVGGWERGKGVPSFESLRGLRKIFGVSIDYLLGFEDFRHIGNEEIHDITGLSDESIEVLRNNKRGGDNRYLFMLDLILSDEEVFNELMKNLVDLVFPPSLVITRDLLKNREYVVFKHEDLEEFHKSSESILNDIRDLLKRFAKRNKDKPIICKNEYHPNISVEEVVEYGKH